MTINELVAKVDSVRVYNVAADLYRAKPIRAGNMHISIQASDFSYCSPRSNLPSLADYNTAEIALFDENMDWINPHEVYPNDDWAGCFENNNDRPVAGYVALQDICDIINSLEQKAINSNN